LVSDTALIASTDNVAKVSGEGPNGDPDDGSDDITALADAAVDAAQRPRLVLSTTASTVDARVGTASN